MTKYDKDELSRIVEGVECRKKLRGFYVPEDTHDLLSAVKALISNYDYKVSASNCKRIKKAADPVAWIQVEGPIDFVAGKRNPNNYLMGTWKPLYF